MRTLPLLLLLSLATRAADLPEPADRAPREKRLPVLGSAIGLGEWKPAGVTLHKGDRVTLSAEPMKTLGPEPEFRRDGVVFRDGKTGPEYLFNTHGRANWQKKGQWKAASSRSFTADADGELMLKVNQEIKWTVTVTVDSP